MLIHGREVKFFLSVEASCEVAEMCPDGDIKRIEEVFDNTQPFRKFQEANARFICIMNAGYEHTREFELEREGYKANIITQRELMTLPPAEFKKLLQEAMSAFVAGNKTTVEVEPDKKNETQA